MAKKARLRSGFTLGGEQAEADPLLEEAFYQSATYDVIQSRGDTRCFIVGRTGSGKSAAMQHLEEINADHVIRISPEDLSLPYIIDLRVIRYLDSLDVNLDLFWIALWKHVLLVEVLRHRYKVNSPEAKQRFLGGLRDKLKKDPAKGAALEYLEDFEGKFWCEADERVREITDKFARRLGGEAGVSVGAGPAKVDARGRSEVEESTEERRETAERFQRVVNETQLGKLNKMLAVLNEDVLDAAHYTYVIIDDLDRDWVDERLANDLIRCLFRTVLDMQRVQNLKVLVALRTNIFQELDFGRRSGGQEEKFRALVLPMRWTRAALVELLDERVRVAGERAELEARTMADLLPQPNRTRGNPIDYILDRTLLRPRDALAFANACLSLGAGRTRLTWAEIESAERTYSTNRLLALRDEWKTTYPGIDQVFEKFRRAPARLSKQEFQGLLEETMLLLSDADFPGVRWLTTLSQAMWSTGGGQSWFSLYQPLTAVLYGFGFIGCSVGSSASPVFYLDDALLTDSESSLDAAQNFYLHRMYHKALDVEPARYSRS